MYVREAMALCSSSHARLKAREWIQLVANRPSPLVLAPLTRGCQLGPVVRNVLAAMQAVGLPSPLVSLRHLTLQDGELHRSRSMWVDEA